MKDELDQGPKINIPDTIIFKYRQPAYWYFTASNGQVKRKSKYNLMNVRIEETFTRNRMGSDIVAYYLTTDDKTGEVTIEYFDKPGFHNFLYNREKVNNGVVQRFIEPKGTNNSMIRAIWSPKVCLLERRVNVNKLQDQRRFGMYERAVTYEGPEVNSVTAPVRGSILPSSVQRLCSSLVNHVGEVSFQKHKIKRLAVNLKVDPNDKIWFLWCTSCRVERTGNISPRSRKAASKTLDQSSVNIDALMRVPKNVRITNMSVQPGKHLVPAGSVKLFDCRSCGRSVQPEMKHNVSYKTIVGHFEQLLLVMGAGQFGGPANQLSWPPEPEVMSALGGVGLGGALGPFGKKHNESRADGKKHHHAHGPPPMPPTEDLEIPPVLRQAHPKMTCSEYRRYRRDPLFLYKQVNVCEDCWLVYAETSASSGEGGMTRATAAATRQPFARRISPLSRSQKSIQEDFLPTSTSKRKMRNKQRKSRRNFNNTGGSTLGGGGSGMRQLNTPGPAIPRRITIDDIQAQQHGEGGRSVLEQIASRSSFDGEQSMEYGGMPATPEEWAQSQALQQSGAPPPAQLQAVPEAFRQTLQEREDAFFRELYQNPNLQRGHPLSHMVVGAAKIRAHQQQMAEYQQNLAAEFGAAANDGVPIQPGQAAAPGGGSAMLQSLSQPSLGAPSASKPPLHGSSSMPPHQFETGIGGDGGSAVVDSPYARLQKLGPPPAGMVSVPKKKKSPKRSATQSAHGGGSKKAGSRKPKKAPEDGGGFASSAGLRSKNVVLSEEDLSASAASHRDFLLQTLHNVRNQLANPSPLIVSGLAVQEEEEPLGAEQFDGQGSVHLPNVPGMDHSEGSFTEPLDDNAQLILRMFDMVDPDHDGRVKKLDFLHGMQRPEVQDEIRHHPQFSALIHTHSYRDAFLAIGTEESKYVNVTELVRFAQTL